MKGNLALLVSWIRGEVIDIPGRVIAVLFLGALLLVPFVAPNPYYIRIIALTAIFAIYAASWDVLSGVTGQLNLGHGLFFGVAAYLAALLNIHANIGPWLGIPLGALGAMAIGVTAGLPALRLRGIYLALVTLAFPVIASAFVFVFPNLTGGEVGLSGVQPLAESRVTAYYIVIAVFVVSVLVMWKFTDPKSKIIRIGVILHAIRQDEITAKASGINSVRYKLLAFAVSGFIAGIAGGLYVHFIRVAGPGMFDLFFSFQVVLWSIFGGIGTIYGAVAGVFILYPAIEFMSLSEHAEPYKIIAFSGVLIVTLLFMPEGLAVWILDKIETKCLRCKVINFSARKHCRACGASLVRELEQADADPAGPT
ncbi:MAG: hypothetical protein U1F17_05330 [Burkholderiaceae bacterium]